MSLVFFINNVVQDIYRGIIAVLNTIDSKKNIIYKQLLVCTIGK